MGLPMSEHWRVGRDPAQPIRIFANVNAGSFGDFVSSLFVVNSIADRFDHKILTVMYRNDRDYKREMLRLLSTDHIIEIPEGVSFPSIDILNPYDPVITDAALVPWFKGGNAWQDIFVSGAMAGSSYLWAFDRLHYLRVPDPDAVACTDELVKRGLNPDRWFCTIHAREPGYYSKTNQQNLRDCDPNVYWHLAVHVAKQLGGQVVRLGHPAMTVFPAMDGLVDLSRETGNSFPQAFAISRSRFFLGGPSGPSAVADAFNVPNGILDAVDYHPSNDGMVMRTIDLVTPDGKLYRQEALFEAGFYKMAILKLLASRQGYRVFKNGAEEAIRLANHLHQMTADIAGWRSAASPDPRPRPNQFSWPPGKPQPRGSFLPIAAATP